MHKLVKAKCDVEWLRGTLKFEHNLHQFDSKMGKDVYMYNIDMQLYVLKSTDIRKCINCLRSNNIDIVCVYCM